MRYAICNEAFQGEEWAQICQFVAACGYEGIEVAPFTFSEDVRNIGSNERAGIRSTAESHGLAIVGLHWLLVSPKGLSVTSTDRAVRAQTAEYLRALVRFCADLGGSIMVFGSPAQRRIEPGTDPTEAVRRFTETLRPALDDALASGITICVEPLPAPEANYILTLSEACEVLRHLDHRAARTILDVKSASAEERPIPDLVRLYSPKIAHVHANDANRRAPGFGNTDFRPIMESLREVRYEGWVSVEAFDYAPDPRTMARQSLQYLKQCSQDPPQRSDGPVSDPS